MKTGNSLINKMAQLVSTTKKDSWVNTLTGLGVAGKDKRLGASVAYNPLTIAEIEQLYASDDIAERVVSMPADLATKKWIDFTTSDDVDGDLAEKMHNEHDRLYIKKKFREAYEEARLYGGSAIFINAQDGRNDDEPLNLDGLVKINSLVVYDRHELQPQKINADVESENYLLPEMYLLTPRISGLGSDINSRFIHASRIIRFDGARLPKRLFISNNYWHDTVLSKIYNQLRNFNTSHDSASTVMQDFRVGILKIRDLADIVMSDNSALLTKRIEQMNLCKSTLGSILLDADSESYENLSTSLNGLETLLDRINDRMIASTGLPHTVVMGEGATGTLSGGGESESRNLRDMVTSIQQKDLKRQVEKINELIQLQNNGPTNGQLISGLGFVFKPIEEESLNDTLDQRTKQATIDNIYWNMGALDAQEVRENRFGKKEYSFETNIIAETESIIDNDEHVHSDPLGGFTGVSVQIDGETPSDSPLHWHKRPNGAITGPAQYRPDGTHTHSTGNPTGNKSDRITETGEAISLQSLVNITETNFENNGDI